MVRLNMCFLFRMAIFHHVSLSEGNYPAKTHSLRLLKRRDIQGAEKCLQNIEYPIDFKTRKFLGVSSGRFLSILFLARASAKRVQTVCSLGCEGSSSCLTYEHLV